MSNRVALVTGANKGIGFAIVRALCKKFDGDVILTARNVDLGKKAVSQLEQEGLTPKFHQLDLLDRASIERTKSFLQSEYGGLDVLVNNAGVAYKVAATEPFAEQAEVSVRVNFRGTLDVCEVLFPLLRDHARVVHVSSMGSKMAIDRCSDDVKRRVKSASEQSTTDSIEKLLDEFVQAAKSGKHQELGWANTAYGMSKIGVTVSAIIQQGQFNKDSRKDLVVNACCPGYVATDMSSFKGHKTIDEGADTPVYLALLPPASDSPKGEFVSDRQIKTFWATLDICKESAEWLESCVCSVAPSLHYKPLIDRDFVKTGENPRLRA
ncbi:hypothetical protein ScPMuIL_009919 [Solemya velum]